MSMPNCAWRQDLLLSEQRLSAKNADVKERAEALAELIERYRGTPAEAKSLMMAARIAPKLQAFELQKRIADALGERFAGDPSVIEFRRQQLGLARQDVLFVGTYTRVDGVVLRFPADLMGRQSVMVFWSRKTEGYEPYLKMIKKVQDELPGQFEVFSFNLDELPDAGASALKALGFNWTVMRLPGGKKSQAFRTYGINDPVGFLVNAYGHALLAPASLNAAEQVKLGVRGIQMGMATLERRLDDPRFLSQVQSLFDWRRSGHRARWSPGCRFASRAEDGPDGPGQGSAAPSWLAQPTQCRYRDTTRYPGMFHTRALSLPAEDRRGAGELREGREAVR